LIEVDNETELTAQLKTNSNALVLFYSSWCPFCRRFLPVFDEHAQNPGSFTFMKVRVDEDENPLWETYSLDSVPSVIIFKDGQVHQRLDCVRGVGLTEEKFSKWIKTS
jgi:thioredoxin 1